MRKYAFAKQFSEKHRRLWQWLLYVQVVDIFILPGMQRCHMAAKQWGLRVKRCRIWLRDRFLMKNAGHIFRRQKKISKDADFLSVLTGI